MWDGVGVCEFAGERLMPRVTAKSLAEGLTQAQRRAFEGARFSQALNAWVPPMATRRDVQRALYEKGLVKAKVGMPFSTKGIAVLRLIRSDI